MHLQVQDRMNLIQLILDTDPKAYADAGRLAMLAEQLGLSDRHADVALRQAHSACKAGDLAAAHDFALQLARQEFKPAWKLGAEVQILCLCCSTKGFEKIRIVPCNLILPSTPYK